MILSSIKSRLIFLYSAIMLSVLTLLSIVLFVGLKQIVYKPIDNNLLLKAKSLDNLIKNNSFRVSFSDINGNRFSFSFSDNRLWIYSSKYSKYFFQIRSLKGDTLEKSLSLGTLSLPFDKKFGRFENIKFKNRVLRLLNFKDKDNKFIIQIAYDSQRENDILKNFSFAAFFSIFLIMLASAVGGFIVSDKALQPINNISEKIKKISKENLGETLNIENVPSELEVLVTSFNDMLQRLDKSFKQQKRFISDISHELKTPLSVMMMQADITLKKERTNKEYEQALESIKTTTAMISELIEKMLLIARLDSKYNKMSFDNVVINDVILEAVSLFRYAASKKGIEIISDCKEKYIVKGDKITLLEVFINIVDNAVKYNKENGKVEINAKKDNKFVVISVKDSGIGIEKDKIGKLTQEFFRADESRSKHTKGFGLGLSIVKRIVELHNGKIEIDSKPGEYTIVKIFLPYA